MRTTHLSAALLASALLLASCGGGSSDGGAKDSGSPTTSSEPTDGGTAGGKETIVDIADFAFDPDDTEVHVGDTVTFANADSATHTAESGRDAPKAFDTGEVEEGKTAAVTFDEAGEYDYRCGIHDYMKGTIRVLE